MSRVGNKPIIIPDGVDVKIDGSTFEVKGKLGTLSCSIPTTIAHKFEDGVITFTRPSNKPQDRANHGLSRALVNNLVVGVTNGFSKTLELEGTGYKWEMRGKKLVLTVGFSHPVEIDIPDGINIEITGMRCVVSGIDKHLVGFISAQIFRKKPVEPYKGKGIRYQGQYVRRKAGKSGA
ncbi:50S ribosomal protein L6 [bacterium]|nr:50S ribosomal protein L6 [bacterium]